MQNHCFVRWRYYIAVLSNMQLAGIRFDSNNNNNIFSLIKRPTNALRCTFTCYAIESILTTNRTDSLQYTALIAAYKAYPPYGARTRYLSLSTPVVIQCAIGPPIYVYIYTLY